MSTPGRISPADDQAAGSERRRSAGSLAGLHDRQTLWRPWVRVAWWLCLLPLAIFCWSSARLRGVARHLGYTLAAFVLLVGTADACGGSLPATATTGDAASTVAPAPAIPPVPSSPTPPTALPIPFSSAPAAPAPAELPGPASPAYGGSPETAASCTAEDYYVNSDGNCVHRPTTASVAPAGATARCTDGTYSFSQHRRGTCSHHGGVSVWL
jgi:hypothetical protein